MLNAELNHRFSSAYTLNVELDHGPVHEKSGSNRGSEPNFHITTAKKQTTHALSSTEAEYMALTAAIQDGLWLKSFFTCLQIPIAFPL